MSDRTRYVGFCAGGPDWPYSELKDCNPQEKLAFLESLGHRQAACVSNAGGNYLRTLFMTATIIGRPTFHDRVHKIGKPVYEFSRHDYAGRLHDVAGGLKHGLECLETGKLDWTRMDAYFAGMERFNREAGADHAVKALLCLVEVPPRLIVERPRDLDSPWTFAALWDMYCQVHIKTMRAVVERYCLHETAVVGALEILNEPDYNWIPDEARIEKAISPHADPLRKYITELHLPQVPTSAEYDHTFCTESDVHFGYELEPKFIGERPRRDTPVLDFPWGAKFDQYVACCADLHEHISFAAKDAAHAGGADVRVVSGAVTNNNLDYLVRMWRANNNTFKYVDAIGIHPYHWPRHSMHDTTFVSSDETEKWVEANPRKFAHDYYKRFDFLKEFTKLIEGGGPEGSYGMAGKTLWLTEFGVPTKKWAHANAALAHYINLFIYQRGEKIPKPVSAIVWEDKWDEFFKQADAKFLHDNHVETLLYYTMRGGGIGESTDEEHSNFTLFDLDCRTTRMEESTFTRLSNHMAGLTGRQENLDYFTFVNSKKRGFKLPLFGKGKKPAAEKGTKSPKASSEPKQPERDDDPDPRLPWTSIELTPEVARVPAMLEKEERQYLQWVTSEKYEGWGAIVELGPWVGGSSAALAAGLRAKGRDAIVHSLDCFQWARDYMERTLPENLPNGADFQHIFERETKEFSQWLCPQKVDLLDYEWKGGDIEILFVDAAKSWELLSAILRTFGPHIVPGKTRVIHQDFGHFFTHWLPLVTHSRPDLWEQREAVGRGTTVTFVAKRSLTGDGGLSGTYSDADFSIEDAARILSDCESKASRYNRGRFHVGLMRKAILEGELGLADRLRQDVLAMDDAPMAKKEVGMAISVTLSEVLRKGEALRNEGHFDDARKMGRICLEANPEHWGARYLMATCDVLTGRSAEAEANFASLLTDCPPAVDFGPGDKRAAMCRLHLADLRIARGDSAAVPAIVSEGIELLSPDNRGLLRWAFDLLWKATTMSAMTPEDLFVVTDAFEARLGENPDLLVLRGLAAHAAGQATRARAAVTRALELEPGNAFATSLRAQLDA
ncbi:MAG: hypothetical protein H6832_18480 [Planctomycetes bacterium]|nr:hypothetical protein [Planctomycetota bacterium]